MVGMIFLQRLVILRCNRMPGIFPLATTHRKTTIGRKDRLQPGLIYHGATDCFSYKAMIIYILSWTFAILADGPPMGEKETSYNFISVGLQYKF